MKHNYLLGAYDDEETLLKGVKAVRKAGYRVHEAWTPFPVHGLDEAMGLQETRLHTAGFIIGACGTIFALGMMSWIGAIDWPIIVGGKPFFNFPAMGPIGFEVTVLTAAVGMTVVFYWRNGFTIFKDVEVVDPKITDDKFVIAFCKKQYPNIEELNDISRILKETGAFEVTDKELENELAPNLYKQHEEEEHDHAAHH